MDTVDNSLVTVCQHPLVSENLRILRDKATNSELFRLAGARLGRLVMCEATRGLPVVNSVVETPLVQSECEILDPNVPIVISPILRAGLVLSDVALEALPMASVYHIGLYRDEETAQPITYYNKLPQDVDYSLARVFLLDPMLATGGSAIAAVDILLEAGVRPEHLVFVCLITSPEGLACFSQAHPVVKVVVAAVDECLNEQHFILPGLGDAGDRAFATV